MLCVKADQQNIKDEVSSSFYVMIRSGQGPFGDSKKDLWLPKKHTLNKRFTTQEPKHVEA